MERQNSRNMDRQNSKFINMRKLHGRIKRSLIQNSVIQTTLRRRIKSKDISIFDVSVGRFGDMHNYYLSGVRNVIGIDPDSDSIDEANKRYQLSKKNYPDLNASLFKETITQETITLPTTESFDIAVCNFTLHYFFESEQMLRNALCNISKRLKKGGYFIGTTIVMKETQFDNNDILFKKGETFHSDSQFGKSYEFKLLDNQNSGNYFNTDKLNIEYLVDIDTFVNVAKEYNLKLISIRPFDKIQGNRKYFSKTEKQVSNLYKTFVFVKL